MNQLDLTPWAYEQTGSDGRVYGMIVLCTREARLHLQKVGILPDDVREMVGMQTAVDIQVAVFEKEAPGVVVQ